VTYRSVPAQTACVRHEVERYHETGTIKDTLSVAEAHEDGGGKYQPDYPRPLVAVLDGASADGML